MGDRISPTLHTDDGPNRYSYDADRATYSTVLQSGQELRNQTYAGLAGVQNRQAPQAGNTTIGQVYRGQAAQLAGVPQDQWRNMQYATANRLQGIASGQQMGAGQLAVRREGNRALAQQQAMARMQRGAGAAMAARGAARNMGNIQLGVAGQAAQAQLADQQMANQTMAGIMGQGREQDIGFAGQNAQLQQQMSMANMTAQNQRIFQQANLNQATSLANMDARLKMMGMNDQAAVAYMAQLFNIDATEMQARLSQELGKKESVDPNYLGGLMTVGGTIIGGIYGGPAGAAAGGAAGSAVGSEAGKA